MSEYGNRGMSFEGLIEYANRRYKQTGAAVIEKQHTLCKPLRNGTGRVVSAKYEEKATVDYMGRYGDTPIAFEAKHTSADRIALSRVEPHQCDFLNEWTANGAGIGFVLIGYKFADYFLIPWAYWEAARAARNFKTTKTVSFEPSQIEFTTTGKASINKNELPEEWRVQTGGNAVLDYLATVGRIWRTEPCTITESAGK